MAGTHSSRASREEHGLLRRTSSVVPDRISEQVGTKRVQVREARRFVDPDILARLEALYVLESATEPLWGQARGGLTWERDALLVVERDRRAHEAQELDLGLDERGEPEQDRDAHDRDGRQGRHGVARTREARLRKCGADVAVAGFTGWLPGGAGRSAVEVASTRAAVLKSSRLLYC